ncbi:MAG TPA: tripartite tricarboxylate transporter TctB family protein [Thermohalobaculum sp.]|nr:tripartite tricarboxylate transporter TctB family protein [Thermohalobaculum sp.]
MTRVNRDTLCAIFLLLGCAVLAAASFEIREPDYGQLSPAAWPRLVVGILTLLSVIYLAQSIRKGVPEPTEGESSDETRRGGIAGFFVYWRNVFWCFALFLAYLLTMPYLGMLIGGLAFVFLLLNALGGWQPKQLALHAIIAVVTVGGMWALFTFGLHVLLPPGQILGRF